MLSYRSNPALPTACPTLLSWGTVNAAGIRLSEFPEATFSSFAQMFRQFLRAAPHSKNFQRPIHLQSNCFQWMCHRLHLSKFCMQIVLGNLLSARTFSVGVLSLSAKQSSNQKRPEQQGGLVQESPADDITDQIPHIVRPMGVVEGTSYFALILAGLAFAGMIYHSSKICDLCFITHGHANNCSNLVDSCNC